MMTELGASSKLNAEWEFFTLLRDEGRRSAQAFLETHAMDLGQPLHPRSRRFAGRGLTHGTSRHPGRPRPADLARLSRLEHPAARARRRAHRRRVRRRAAARALDADLHGERGALHRAVLPDLSARRPVRQADGGQRLGDVHRQLHDRKLGAKRAVLAVVLAGALVTYGGVSLFVAFFVLAPMAHALFRAAGIPRRLMPAAIVLGTSTFTMSALPGTPAIQNAIPMPFFGTTPFAAPGLGIIASIIMLGFGLWWLARAEAKARASGEGYGDGRGSPADAAAEDPIVRERATTARAFDPAEIAHGAQSAAGPPIALAVLPLVVVIAVNLVMSLVRPAAPRRLLSRRRSLGRDLARRPSAASGPSSRRSPRRSSC